MARTAGSYADLTGPRLRAAARSLFARYVFAAVSMRQIASEIGVQAGALYNYTSDRQSLPFDLMRCHMDELHDARRAEPKVAARMAQLKPFARFHTERSEAVFLANIELRCLEPDNRACILARRKAHKGELTVILERAQASGQVVVPDAKVASYAVIAMLTGVYRWYRDDGRLSRAQLSDIYLDMTRAAVGAAPVRA